MRSDSFEGERRIGFGGVLALGFWLVFETLLRLWTYTGVEDFRPFTPALAYGVGWVLLALAVGLTLAGLRREWRPLAHRALLVFAGLYCWQGTPKVAFLLGIILVCQVFFFAPPVRWPSLRRGRAAGSAGTTSSRRG